MEPLLQSSPKSQDNFPVWSKLGHHHHTWANTYHSYPELYIQPRSVDELKEVVTLARRHHRRIAITGCGHSPSDLTCTSSWLVNLDYFAELLEVNKQDNTVVMQAGIRLHSLGLKLKEYGLAMPNLGSIDEQSIAGAIGTGTHGSSLKHGLMSQSVKALKILLADGSIVPCSPSDRVDLFRAALLSLGALGIITEITFQAVPVFNIEWLQSLHPLEDILSNWDKDLWIHSEFTRVWWMPYMKQCIRWRAEKTSKPCRAVSRNIWSGNLGYYTYHTLLYCALWVPQITPLLEKFVLNVQCGFTNGIGGSGIEEGRTGLLLNCLYSQFVNEWAIPLEKGPEALSRLSAWLNGDQKSSQIPFSSQGIWVHAPIEIRVADGSKTSPRAYLDPTAQTGPTLYLNATLYRPFGCDPNCRARYYQAFEYLMKELGGRPHWAKNFSNVSQEILYAMYPDIGDWMNVRSQVDPDGMFVGDWHRRWLLPENEAMLPFEERLLEAKTAKHGGILWIGDSLGNELPIKNSQNT